MNDKLELIYIDAGTVRHLEHNPRKKKNRDVIAKLNSLIREHGFQNPLQVYEENDGSYMILCGNHRFDAGIQLGMTEFPCIIYRGDRKKAIARAISDNKSHEWTDWNDEYLKALLKFIDDDIDISALAATGFDEKEILQLFEEHEEERPEVEFSEELLLEHNYIVLYFDNPLDWEVAKEKFKLKTVKDLIERKGQPRGIGRVVRGSEWLPKIMD
jgi:ParB-like chromosome segregation protein Spo0J